MLRFIDFIAEMNVHDLGDGFSVHNHDLGDGHHLMVTFDRDKNNGVATHFSIHTPDKPEGTTDVGSLPKHKSVPAIMKVRRSIQNHLNSHDETNHIDMYGTTDRQREAYRKIGNKMGSVKPIGNGIRVHLSK